MSATAPNSLEIPYVLSLRYMYIRVGEKREREGERGEREGREREGREREGRGERGGRRGRGRKQPNMSSVSRGGLIIRRAKVIYMYALTQFK